jgi:glycosyltransferase involved in cell wall biosynthesis
MIVKNAEDTLEGCLDALDGLRKSLGDNCELIIADTGSSDKTSEIAEKYADKFLTFPWNNDFSEARNVTLRAAKGEWFMFIDADEELVGGAEIAEFFLSGEYKNYNSATYIQRNYSDLAATSHTDYRPARLTKITPETIFEGNVHEALSSFGEPIKHFNSYVHHFGYVSDGGKKLTKARERLKQLEKGLETETDINKRLLIMCEMSDAAMICDPARAAQIDLEALAICEKFENSANVGAANLNRIRPQNSETEKPYYYVKYVFGGKCAGRLLEAKQYKAAAFAVSKYFTDRDKSQNEYERMAMANDIDLHAILALSLFNMKKYPETAQLLFSYAKLLEDYFDNKLCSADYFFNTPKFTAPANIKKCADIIGLTRLKLKNNPEAAMRLAAARDVMNKLLEGEK